MQGHREKGESAKHTPSHLQKQEMDCREAETSAALMKMLASSPRTNGTTLKPSGVQNQGHSSEHAKASDSAGSHRPARKSCIAARDHIVAWRLQERASFRAYKLSNKQDLKSKKAQKAAACVSGKKEGQNGAKSKLARGEKPGQKNQTYTRAADGKFAKKEKPVATASATVIYNRAPDGKFAAANSPAKADSRRSSHSNAVEGSTGSAAAREQLSKASASGHHSSQKPELASMIRRAKAKRNMALVERTERTRGTAIKGMKREEWEDVEGTISFILCPTEEKKGGDNSKNPCYMGKLPKAKLSAQPEATILHLKRFLVSKLAANGSLKDIEISCRGLILPDNKNLHCIKNLLWPKNHHMDPVLRYRRKLPTKPVSQEMRLIQNTSATMEEMYPNLPPAPIAASSQPLMQPIPVSQMIKSTLERKPSP